ncbi:CAAX geranylgeranyltransferase alpha subunit [Yamadazyma tenuis]|uniref:Protein farnesyltransferase/geranylgeranyltransferase type-1 subunit alpha n=1 Tax=Candida tenuis (strain ATCC 10573 / BCRC 21748 / CBS 615 / JCM 9827 / NBRC 10315 / NRRL Y-1498 / VKM Y-70) TaxID=590646 RepID=G3BEL3_CANTC|nr:protein prenylyltransferase [Yamadazyma tenuis ATCC 10573]XP_006690414.1 uncharacterized protein CANTEDRAFT_116652 [Yamadazyma tenuis ATCC 10573]EGV61199.1 protein prenylyltransferase [Yamadazyma tenuis ATCC 10573]EGV61200.1 hypothetical protein CANTEDRAFT_116652 [Yamadazyma tenuis ATCC 10573]WEJ94181.1 CAAX geranylgeranyltransferase alpha subunit [Yamadazyma tenuis]
MNSEYTYDDIEPVALNEEQPQLCQILYTDQFKSVMGTLLALMKKNEYSDRALALTGLGIEILPSHYSIWIYRYNVIREIGKDLVDELDWLETISLDNEKNYQIWNYRQLIIEQVIGTTGQYNYHREFPIMAAMLSSDAKNHHVWTYRKWVVSRFGLFADEKENSFVEAMIEQDVRNNSAWNHRFYLKFGHEQGDAATSDVVDEELEYVKHKITVSPQNESSWNYLLGICNKFNISLQTLEGFCKQFVNDGTDSADEIELIKSSYALEVLAQVYNDDKSILYYDLLSTKYDPIRKNYWQYMKSMLI